MRWRSATKVLLALFVLGLSTIIFFGLRERERSAQPVVVERADPDALIQSKGSRVVQADAVGENLRVDAVTQLTYPDGALRLLGGVEVNLGERDGRDAFIVTGESASVNPEQTLVNVNGKVRFKSGGGLTATSEVVIYDEQSSVILMPERAVFSREGLEATADDSVYNRDEELLRLLKNARVILTETDSETTIQSPRAVIAENNGHMIFRNGVEISANGQMMQANMTEVFLRDDTARLESLSLQGGARVFGKNEHSGLLREMSGQQIHLHYAGDRDTVDEMKVMGSARVFGREKGPGDLREMAAQEILVHYADVGDVVDGATLKDGATVVFYGAGESAGTDVVAETIAIAFTENGEGLGSVLARDQVVLRVPGRGARNGQTIMADELDVHSSNGRFLDRTEFAGNVEYHESEDGNTITRTVVAERLDADLSEGLTSLDLALFSGDVRFEDGPMSGRSEEARYLLAESTVSLRRSLSHQNAPRVVDQRGSIEADTIDVTFKGPVIRAVGDVESVLSSGGDEKDDETHARPGLLDAEEPVLITAASLVYTASEKLTSYSGGTHLWQGATEFHAEHLLLDEGTGDVRLEGDVRTRTEIRQTNEETMVAEASTTQAQANEMLYENELHQITYIDGAELKGPKGDLSADVIEVHLLPDNRTLDRFVAEGDVTLVTETRLVTGETLVFYDEDGRYEMTGDPVVILEETAESEDECRMTSGLSITFYLAGDDVLVDGQSEARTETLSQTCPPTM